MNLLSAYCKASFIVILLGVSAIAPQFSYGQVYSYLNDSVGNYNSIATNASGAPLGRINSAVTPATACRYGYSSKNFPPTLVFATTLPADTIAVWPNSGYAISITNFTVGLRRSNTGPDSARLAYSTNGGVTWTDQGYSFSPKNAGCDTTITAVWTKTVTVTYPNKLEFAVFGFAASNIAGTFQIDTLTINGTVHTPAAIYTPAEEDGGAFSIFPNPVKKNATFSYHLATDEQVSLTMYNILGQEVSQVVHAEMQQPGDHTYSIPIITPGLYVVKLLIGNNIYTRKMVRL